MKDLKEYIKELHSLDKVIGTETTEDGTVITYYENYDFDDLDNELIITFNLDHLIFEGKSIYKGCIETAKIIAAKVDKVAKQGKNADLLFTKEMFKNIDNIYFNTLYVNVNIVNGDECNGIFETTDINAFYDPTNNIFVTISITMDIGKEFYNKFHSCIGIVAHELRHGYQELGYQNRGTSIIKSRIKLRKKFDKSIFIDEVTHVINKDECESYLAQLDAEIGDRKFSDIQQAVKWLNKYSDVWDSYKGLVKYINDANDKKLYNQFKKSWGKFINHLGHILNDHVEDPTIREHASRSFMKHILENKKFE